jgi:hypothetical protein
MTILASTIHYAIAGRGAVISPCGEYRYLLTRVLQGPNPPLIFCMLNPSTADATFDDPTIRRCVGFANREGARALIVINLYAMRATDPRELLKALDPVGPDNDNTIKTVLRSAGKRVVCAWGAFPNAASRAMDVARMLQREMSAELVCLGVTSKGMPRHPLYVKSDQPLVPYTGS